MPSPTPPQQDEPPASVFELEQPDVYGKYMLSTPQEILFVLRTMLRRGCMASVYFDRGRSFFRTSVLAIGGDERQLVLDVGSDETVNRKALNASRLLLAASLDNVKIQFAVDGLAPSTFEGRPAFLAAAPEVLLRLQRREYFRLETSPTEPLRCRIPAPGADGSARTLDLPVLEISGGGLSLMAPTEQSLHFQTGTLYPDCRLEIPNENVIAASLCVRRVFTVLPANGPEYLRVGCEFANLPEARLTTIQRYITRIERERKAKLSGLE